MNRPRRHVPGTVRVRYRPGEKINEYIKRLVDASPPLNERQKETIRRAVREYWSIVRARQPWTGPERRLQVDRRKRQLPVRGRDRRKGDRRGGRS